jgi:hypothetical protein
VKTLLCLFLPSALAHVSEPWPLRTDPPATHPHEYLVNENPAAGAVLQLVTLSRPGFQGSILLCPSLFSILSTLTLSSLMLNTHLMDFNN